MFFAIEGLPCSGKSYIIRKLHRFLLRHKKPCTVFPYTNLPILKIISAPKRCFEAEISVLERQKDIWKLYKKNKDIMLVEHYIDKYVSYYGSLMTKTFVWPIVKKRVGSIRPTKTIYIDIPPDLSINRLLMAKKIKPEQASEVKTYLVDVRKRYMTMIREWGCDRYGFVDGEADAKQMLSDCKRVIIQYVKNG